VGVVEAFRHDDNVKDIAAWNGESDFHDVMRKMLANTTNITLNPNKSQSYTFTYTIDPSWQPGQMYAVAFLQDPFDNSVIQTGFSSPSSGVETLQTMAGFSLEQSIPNPANGMAAIGYTLGTPRQVVIELYNASGERVALVDEGVQESGAHRASIDVGGLPAGAYTYTITAGKYRESKMMTVVR
jgi:hypothetical protein